MRGQSQMQDQGVIPRRISNRFAGGAGPVVAALLLALGLSLIPAMRSELQAADAREVLTAVNSRIVKIYGAGGLKGLAAYGTGFLISPDGYIVTVWNHVLDDDDVGIVLWDGRKVTGKVVGAEPALDLAVLKIPGEDLPCFDLAAAVDVGPGTRILAFSNMFKVAAGNEPVSVLHGVIAARTPLSARRGSFDLPYTGPAYIVDAITNNSGSAGGALTTRDGRLIGMIGKEVRNRETNTWINYAMPISELRTAIEEIRTGKFKPRADRESELENGSDAAARYAPGDFGMVLVPDIVLRTPAYLDRVLPGSPAEKLGLKPNDLILFVNDELVPSCRVLKERIGKLEEGSTLRLVVRRGTALVTLEFPVEAKSPDTK